jgi:prepilin-type N-terminal cleavage/methylation domain-containing protein
MTNTNRYKRDRGFSLLELLIVVAIILIVATIAIPSLVRSRQQANESVAVANLRNMNSAQLQYSAANRNHYGTISELIVARLIPSSMSIVSSGYQYTMELSADRTDYTARAIGVGAVGGRYDYFTRTDFIIRYTGSAARAPVGKAGQPVN